ncbi:hypothetical protein [Thermocrispum municipale]|uniref:hypothetical protein n=1 Tax=Thermocrispum municipale TaxID=37926 RepID=UPI0005BB86EF|nr:hypothetical protein [Thermocrispum municipale]
MGIQGRKIVRMGQTQRNATCVSPRSLYARPMALRQLYTDAGTLIRQGQREAAAAAAASQENSH